MKILPTDDKFSSFSTDELLSHINNFSHITRARIVATLGKRIRESAVAFEAIFEAIQNPININSRVMGLVSVAWYGIITVLENGSANQKQQILQLMPDWEPQDKEDLIDYLKDFPEYVNLLNGV